MTRKEFKEKTFRVAMDLHCIGMLLPEKALKDCKAYFDSLNDNIVILINELDKYIPEGEEQEEFYSNGYKKGYEDAKKQFDRYGKWMQKHEDRWIYPICSECGYKENVVTNYCANCGALMAGYKNSKEEEE